MKQAKWRLPSESVNFKNGHFENLSETPVMAKGVSYTRILSDYIKRPKTTSPVSEMPHVQTNLKALDPDKPVIVWFGHSSYLIHVKGLNILVDPVFSGHASPFKSMVKAFRGANTYSVDDMPDIDILLLTHNHYDHLDIETVSKLRSKVLRYVLPLGVAKTIAAGEAPQAPITEMDWWETIQVLPEVSITATPARHFSGRGLLRGGSLWCSYVLEIAGYRFYVGGDSGYDEHFGKIGEKYGPFDIALLECGQYNENWPNIHMMPEETVQAAIDLQAKVFIPVHWGKFVLANHPWNEPIVRATAAALKKGVKICTPLIGEPVILDSSYPASTWWNIS